VSERTLPEVVRHIERVERDLRDHVLRHVEVAEFSALKEDLAEIKEGQRWLSRMLVTQLIVLIFSILGGVAVALVASGVL
jgi:hypothetical protein